MSWLPPKKFVLGCLGSVLFTFLVCSGTFVWWLNQTDGYISPDFCTPRDELYQTIKTEAQNWLTELSKSSFPIIHFSTASGREYVADGEPLGGDTPYFFVTVQKKYNQGPSGTRGYMYAASGKLPDFYPEYMKITYVDSNIYCYEHLKD
ncbi:MAG: hypothetical protein H0X30_37655 [Anaerolineae bacterium]|nr:hypothetical protein [Anaerolineae bacterium]